MLVKVTDRIWLDSRHVKSLCLYETNGTDGRYQVYADHKMIGGFNNEAAALKIDPLKYLEVGNETKRTP